MATKIFIQTFGCSLNQSDSEVMAGLLKQADFQITDNINDANMVVVNSCAVKGKSQTNCFKFLREAKKRQIPVVVAGCIPQTMPDKLEGYSMIGTHQVNNIVEVVEETLHDNPVALVAVEKNTRLNLPKIRINPAVEIVPILKGCMGACTYCIVKKARGNLDSFSSEEIVAQVNAALRDGVKEIWLTSQDNGCYGFDRKTNLAMLLHDVCGLPGRFWVRSGMSNPDHVIHFVPELIEAFQHEKMFKFLHIPVQSGNDQVLAAMRRGYTVKEYKEIVKQFREAIPDITISTDIIVGFPGETEKQFFDTLKLIRDTQPEVLNISRFTARPGTPAEKMQGQLPGAVIKNRSRELTELHRVMALQRNKRWVGWEGEILIDEHGKEGSFVGRNFAYKPVIVHGDIQLGQVVRVRVDYVTSFDLRATIV